MTKGAKYIGHDKSMMERLMEFPFYKRRANGEFNEKFIIQIVKNYRSVPELLEIPNKLFYEMKLEAQIKPSTIRPLTFYATKSKHNK